MPVKSRTTDTYEYRKDTKRPRVMVKLVEIGECPESVIFNELKVTNGRLYHSIDTNRFFYDFNNKRYELNLFGEGGGGGEAIDYNQFAKKTDIPKKTSQLRNDSGFITTTSLSDFLSRNHYVTEEMLNNSISNLVTKSVFNTLNSKVNTMNTKLNSMDSELEELRRSVEELSSESDYGDEISELFRRIEELESGENWEEFERE